MKKTLLALAVLGSFAGAASAQSSVTLSGAVDVGFVRKNGTSSVDTAASSRSNFTISGSEDLGNGMKAIFLLNHRFKPDTGEINVAGNTAGTSPQYFWRNSWVGLSSAAAGDIKLGRILFPLQDFNGNYEPWNGGDTVANVHTGGIKATVRATNSVSYTSPSFAGVKVQLATAERNGQLNAECDSCASSNLLSANSNVILDNLTKNRPVGAGLRYDAGPVSAAVAYDKNVLGEKTLGLYGKYDFQVAKVMFQYEKGDVSTNSAAKDGKRFSISATAPFGAATAKLGYMNYASTAASGDASNAKKRIGAGVDYALSKRTTVYADVAKNSGNGWTTTEKKAMYDLGIWHKF